jgi:hypothetical protein
MYMNYSEYWKISIETPEVKKEIADLEERTKTTLSVRERIIFQFGYLYCERNTRAELKNQKIIE